MLKVCIDPGHGGGDRSNRGPTGYIEADGVLDIALKLRSFLEKHNNVEVMMTREVDTTVTLPSRVAMANKADADIFVSVHTNAFDSPAAEGIETFHSIIPAPGTGGHKLAACIQEEICKATGRKNRGVKTKKGSDGRDYYYVIKNTKMPAVIVECGFHTNFTEEKLLKTDEFRMKCALGIGRGILRCFDMSEPNPNIDIIGAILRKIETMEMAFADLQTAKVILEDIKALIKQV